MNISEQINKDIYNFIIKDWKNTSLITDHLNNKSFSLFLKDLIEYSNLKSSAFINYEVLEKLENIENEKLKSIFSDLNKLYYEKVSFSSLIFSKDLLDFLNKKYKFLNSLRPQGWENFILSNNKVDLNLYYENYSLTRKNNFSGICFSKENNFSDNVSIFFTAYNYINHNIYPLETLTKSVVDYVIEFNSYINSKKIIKLMDNNYINIQDVKNDFSLYLNFQENKLDFELQKENLKHKEDITKILKKIKTN